MSQQPLFPNTPGTPYEHGAAGATDPYGVQVAQAAAAAQYGMAAYPYAYPQVQIPNTCRLR